MSDFLKSKLGQFCIGTGWLGLLGMLAYMLATNQLTLSGIEQLIRDAAPVLTGIAAGGGVHFIYNRTNGKNGGNNNGTASSVH